VSLFCRGVLFFCASIEHHHPARPSQPTTTNPPPSPIQNTAALSFVLHLDTHLGAIIAQHGPATYALLFAIVFCETGLVLTPFLPGDSLLFAAGTFAALGSLHLPTLLAVFVTSAFLGDALNYGVGAFLGARAVEKGIVKREAIAKTEAFYAKHGGRAVVLARFVPIVRTFAPFVAGVAAMPYKEFSAYNAGGAVLWGVGLTVAGALFGWVEAFFFFFLGVWGEGWVCAPRLSPSIPSILIFLSFLSIHTHTHNTATCPLSATTSRPSSWASWPCPCCPWRWRCGWLNGRRRRSVAGVVGVVRPRREAGGAFFSCNQRTADLL
jgi:membrane-associated protein